MLGNVRSLVAGSNSPRSRRRRNQRTARRSARTTTTAGAALVTSCFKIERPSTICTAAYAPFMTIDTAK
jgi:hypothetical protein